MQIFFLLLAVDELDVDGLDLIRHGLVVLGVPELVKDLSWLFSYAYDRPPFLQFAQFLHRVHPGRDGHDVAGQGGAEGGGSIGEATQVDDTKRAAVFSHLEVR